MHNIPCSKLQNLLVSLAIRDRRLARHSSTSGAPYFPSTVTFKSALSYAIAKRLNWRYLKKGLKTKSLCSPISFREAVLKHKAFNDMRQDIVNNPNTLYYKYSLCEVVACFELYGQTSPYVFPKKGVSL